MINETFSYSPFYFSKNEFGEASEFNLIRHSHSGALVCVHSEFITPMYPMADAFGHRKDLDYEREFGYAKKVIEHFSKDHVFQIITKEDSSEHCETEFLNRDQVLAKYFGS